MPQWSNAHLMFCEGPHDAAFLNRVLKKQLGFQKLALKLSELPYPLANVLQASFKDRAAEDLRLDLARKFFLPDYVLALDSVLVLVFSYGGSNRKVSMLPFLENLFALLAVTNFSSLQQTAERPVYAYTVFADADARGESSTRDLISTEFATVGDSAWLTNAWMHIKTTKAASQSTDFGPAAAYVWRKSTEDGGTLEDLILECLDGDAELHKTLEYLDSRFDWSPPAGSTASQICASSAKRLKAAFCVEGQKQKPGGSLGVILDQSELLGTDKLKKSSAVQDCLAFLAEWVMPTPVEPAAATTQQRNSWPPKAEPQSS
ncbi:hypothetical protein [Variovorax sp. 38R]|uniref:hypothetical protein n=1 Tax=Variovorax sp. 38R TaxID=2774875 RepID=UPI00177B683F|nr:hypothetical protein [Variovorax sp. 38R]QOF77155.1 hypothetical protein IG196_22750 [Variovorax sp. 38R]